MTKVTAPPLYLRVASLDDVIIALMCAACRMFLADGAGGLCRMCRANRAYAEGAA